MAAIKYRVERIMTDGECILIGDNGEAAHGETVYCQTKHDHSKDCAVTLLDAKADKAAPSVREKIDAWFAQWDAAPADPTAVEMPKKVVQVVEDGKTVNQSVDDKDLS
jgi:hypothetical protein